MTVPLELDGIRFFKPLKITVTLLLFPGFQTHGWDIAAVNIEGRICTEPEGIFRDFLHVWVVTNNLRQRRFRKLLLLLLCENTLCFPPKPEEQKQKMLNGYLRPSCSVSKWNLLVPIAIAENLHLLSDKTSKQRAGSGARQVVFYESTEPNVDVVRMFVEIQNLLSNSPISHNFCEVIWRCDALQSTEFPPLVVSWKVIWSSCNLLRLVLKCVQAKLTEAC